jgi:hypothetical protein
MALGISSVANLIMKKAHTPIIGLSPLANVRYSRKYIPSIACHFQTIPIPVKCFDNISQPKRTKAFSELNNKFKAYFNFYCNSQCSFHSNNMCLA